MLSSHIPSSSPYFSRWNSTFSWSKSLQQIANPAFLDHFPTGKPLVFHNYIDYIYVIICSFAGR